MTVNSADGRNGFCRFCTLKEATQNGAKRRSVWQIFLYRKYQHKQVHAFEQTEVAKNCPTAERCWQHFTTLCEGKVDDHEYDVLSERDIAENVSQFCRNCINVPISSIGQMSYLPITYASERNVSVNVSTEDSMRQTDSTRSRLKYHRKQLRSLHHFWAGLHAVHGLLLDVHGMNHPNCCRYCCCVHNKVSVLSGRHDDKRKPTLACDDDVKLTPDFHPPVT